MTVPQPDFSPGMHFALTTATGQYGLRLGNILLRRPGCPEQGCSIPTPNFLTSTSRGVVPHLSRDHHNRTDAIRWVNVPFETFLDRHPPVPTLQQGKQPLHTFLGFNAGKHVMSITVRDPSDGRDMPPNGSNHVSVYCSRGVRKVSPSDWRSYVFACRPDIVVALSDTPLKDTPYSQKRLTKSIDRSAKWLADILRPITPSNDSHPYRPSVLVHMAGGPITAARRAFSDSLLEPLHGKDAEQVAPLRCLDEGVIGYTFDLVPLRLCLEATMRKATDTTPSDTTPSNTIGTNLTEKATSPSSQRSISTDYLIPLINASLESLPTTKLRVANTAVSPHEILRFIQSSGIDLFDAHWAQNAASVGIALDFTFPVSPNTVPAESAQPRRRSNGKRDIGHNLYDPVYALDFTSLASCFSPAFPVSVVAGGPGSTDFDPQSKLICPCLACSPTRPTTQICDGPSELKAPPTSEDTQTSYHHRPPLTRAYMHHLLRTHEMSAHSLLVMHNLSVLDAFFTGVRMVIQKVGDCFEREVERFVGMYDEDMVVFEEATADWRDVDLARGKGRLAREKAKQESVEGLVDVVDN